MPTTKGSTTTYYAVTVQIPMKRGGFSQGVSDLSSTDEGEIDTYNPEALANQAIKLLIDYINHKTKRGGYYRNVGDWHLQQMALRFTKSLQSFSTDTNQRAVILTQKLYDDKGIEDEVFFEFERGKMTMQD